MKTPAVKRAFFLSNLVLTKENNRHFFYFSGYVISVKFFEENSSNT